jgi:predicted RecA/RadA family phage recombinase
MSYAFQDDLIGLPGMLRVDSAPHSPAYPGMLAHAVDPVLGGGEFLYLPGVANLVAGSLVTYDQLTPSVTLSVTGAKGGSPVAVAMAAPQAGQYGWFQITGNALIAKTAGAGIAQGAAVGITATAGQVTTSAGGAATAGALTGAVCNAAAATTDATVNVGISRPVVN